MTHQIGILAGRQGLGAVSLGRAWRKFRHFLRRQPWLLGALAAVLAAFLRFTNWTNPQRAETRAVQDKIRELGPLIIALWHGQHLMASFVAPKDVQFVALFSRSADAEMNAKIAEKLGVEVVRGSGGREAGQRLEKGGARALIQLKRALDEGKSVVMIADISKATPRHLCSPAFVPTCTPRARTTARRNESPSMRSCAPTSSGSRGNEQRRISNDQQLD